LTPKAAVKPSTRGYFEEVLFLFNVLYRSDPELPKAAVKPSTRGYFEEVLFLFNVLYRSDPELPLCVLEAGGIAVVIVKHLRNSQ
jgi:hypothetical protein